MTSEDKYYEHVVRRCCWINVAGPVLLTSNKFSFSVFLVFLIRNSLQWTFLFFLYDFSSSIILMGDYFTMILFCSLICI